MPSVSVVLILLVIVVTLVIAYPNPNQYPHEKPHYDLNEAPALFQKFIKDYNRHYKDEEDYYLHYFAFFKNLIKIDEMNDDGSPGGATFDINKFADYTKEEERNLFGLLIPDKPQG